MTSPSPPPRSPSPLPPRSRRPKPLTAKGRSISAPESPSRGRNINVKYYGNKMHHDLLKEDSDSSSSSSSSSSRSRSPSPSCSDRDTNELIKAAALALGGNDDDDDMSAKKTITRTKAQRSISEARGQPRRPSLKKTQSTGSKKRSAKNFLRSAVQRSISFGSARPSTDSLASGLFRVSFQKMPQVQEFEKIDSALKGQLWYVGGELKCLMAQEIARNQQADDDNDKNNNFSSLFDEDALSSLMMSEELSKDNATEKPPHEVCWRGLEHILEGEDRSQRIRHTVRGIVSWHRDAKDMGYDDPDELRIVSKARTKPDRSKAHKKAMADEKFVKNSGETARESSPQPRGRRKSKLQKVTLPKLNWSPKPNKRRLSSSKDAKGEAAKAG